MLNGGLAGQYVPGPFGDRGQDDASRVEEARRLAAKPGAISRLNQLADLAAHLLRTESAQVSIISDEQTVMGGFGASADDVGDRTSPAQSLCTVTVEQAGWVAIPDTAADERVRHLPPVTAGVARTYLGVPLRSTGDASLVIGALCVFSSEVREWTDDDARLLERLAAPVMAELELVAVESAYADDRMIWQMAVDAAGVGAFDWDLASGDLRWDERLLEVFGLSRETFGGTIEAFEASVHPDDRDRVNRALQEAIDSCGVYEAEYRVVRPDGKECWVAARGQALADDTGTVVRVIGAAYDTTAVRDSEARVARTLDAMPTAYFQLDADWQFTYANPEARRLLGGVSSEVVGHNIWELFPEAVGSDFEYYYRGAAMSGVPSFFEAYYPPPLDAWYEVRCWPTPDGLSVYFIEVTDRRRAIALLDDARERADLLAEATRVLTDSLDADDAMRSLVGVLVPALGDWCIITLADGRLPDDLLADGHWRTRLRDRAWAHRDGERAGLVETYARSRMAALTDESLVARAMVSGEPVIVEHGATQAILAVLESGPVEDLCRELAPEAVAIVPLKGPGRLVGLMSVFRSADRPTFTQVEVETLLEIAGRAGLALDHATQFASQRDLATELQRSLLTSPPADEVIDIAVRYEPAAAAAQVGGDWYDAFRQPDGALNLVIGDVVGHDIVAAAAMGQLRSLLRGIAVADERGPASVLSRLDTAMSVLGIETMASSVVVRLEQTPEERAAGVAQVRWSNAGHPPPIIVVPDAEAPGGVRTELLWSGRSNPMLGMRNDVERDEMVATLPAGATLLLYTDGVIERRRQHLDEGLALLERTVAEVSSNDVPLVPWCDQVVRAMLPARPEDDVAVVAVRLRPSAVTAAAPEPCAELCPAALKGSRRCTSMRLPHQQGSGRLAREALSAHLDDVGIARAAAWRVETVLGELIANAVDHGQPLREGDIEVAWCVGERDVRLSVMDGGDVAALLPADMADVSGQARGRGLAMVAALAEDWTHQRVAGTRVTATVALDLDDPPLRG